MEEIWKNIVIDGVDYKGDYKVSNMGLVKSFKLRNPRILRSTLDGCGYGKVTLYKDNIGKVLHVHKLVGVLFKRPLNGNEVFHHKKSKEHNESFNLIILSKRKNCSIEKTIKSGLPVGVTRDKKSKFKIYVSKIRVGEIRIYLGRYKNKQFAAKAYEIAIKVISKGGDCCIQDIRIMVNNFRLKNGIEKLRTYTKSPIEVKL